MDKSIGMNSEPCPVLGISVCCISFSQPLSSGPFSSWVRNWKASRPPRHHWPWGTCSHQRSSEHSLATDGTSADIIHANLGVCPLLLRYDMRIRAWLISSHITADKLIPCCSMECLSARLCLSLLRFLPAYRSPTLRFMTTDHQQLTVPQ